MAPRGIDVGGADVGRGIGGLVGEHGLAIERRHAVVGAREDGLVGSRIGGFFLLQERILAQGFTDFLCELQ
ncbi:MAG: hypothetical protein QM749_11945 [Aquabacterium sp.]